MDFRKLLMFFITVVLTASVLVGSVSALTESSAADNKTALENVRDYVTGADGVNYAVDGDHLFVGNSEGWARVDTPKNIMVSAVALDANSNNIYIGAANEMAIFRSTDMGESWDRFLLNTDEIGMITEVAVDSIQNLIYVGTDTAGVFRLRDVGSSLVLSGQLLLDERVQEIVVDDRGAGMAFARTDTSLYRAENFGLRWVTVNTVNSVPTALAIAGDDATVYVGTMDRGLLKSTDGGITWALANDGLGNEGQGLIAGSRLQVSALTTDPAQPNVLYVASNYLNGSTTIHSTPSIVALSTNDARTWNMLDAEIAIDGVVAKLLPVANNTGAVYALTTMSRTPQALGSAPAMVATAAVAESTATTGLAGLLRLLNTTILAWIVAAVAGLTLLFAIGWDLRGSANKPEPTAQRVTL